MAKIKFVAVRYVNSQIVFIEEYDSVMDALGAASKENHELLMVGMSPEWSVYLVEGSHWIMLDNYDRSGVRYDFISFLLSVGGKFGSFDVANFKAMDREDF